MSKSPKGFFRVVAMRRWERRLSHMQTNGGTAEVQLLGDDREAPQSISTRRSMHNLN